MTSELIRVIGGTAPEQLLYLGLRLEVAPYAFGAPHHNTTTAAVLQTCCVCADGYTTAQVVWLQGGQLIGIPTLR